MISYFELAPPNRELASNETDSVQIDTTSWNNDGWKVLFISIGAICGALLRWKISSSIAVLNSNWTKWSILVINAIGSLLLGVIAALGTKLSSPYSLSIGVGFCGSFTTFSTYAVDVVKLFDNNESAQAMLLFILTNIICIGVAALSFILTKRSVI